MITLVAGLLSVIFALIALVAHLLGPKDQSATTQGNQVVVDQIKANDAKIQSNNDQIQAEKDKLFKKEKNETNQSIIDDLNSRK